MAILIPALLVSLIPSLALIYWLTYKMRKPESEEYKLTCKKALRNGFLSTVFVVLLSGTLAILLSLLGFKDGTSFLSSLLHDFIVLAFAEELMKSLMFVMTLKKADYPSTWLDRIAFMVIVALGFQILEAVVYSFSTNAGQIIVRGITIMHGGYGFIEGWFYGKAAYTGKKHYAGIGFVIAWLLHGAFDFGLSPEFAALGDWSAVLSVSLAFLSLVILIVMIVFFAKKNKKPQYLEPIPSGTSFEAQA